MTTPATDGLKTYIHSPVFSEETAHQIAPGQVRQNVAGVLFVEPHAEAAQLLEGLQREAHLPLGRQPADLAKDRRCPSAAHSPYDEIMHSVSLGGQVRNAERALAPWRRSISPG